VEPSTAKLLLHEYSEKQIRAMFPKNSSQATRERAQKISDALDNIPSLSPQQQEQALQACNELIQQTPDCEKGLRVDLVIHGEDSAELWADVGVVHTTKSSSREKTLRFFTGEARNPQLDISSPPVRDYAVHKKQLYLPLLNRAKLQKHQRKRTSDPLFYAAIFSHLGEFSEEAIKLIEALASRAYALTAAGFFSYTQVPAVASANHRNSLKNSLAAALVNGFGLMLCATNLAAVP